MFELTEEIKKKIEDDYNYYSEMNTKSEEPTDKSYYLGKWSAIADVLSYLGYTTKLRYSVVKKEEE